MKSFKKQKKFFRFIPWMVIISFLTLFHGCHYYYKVTQNKEPVEPAIIKLQQENNFIILHSLNKVWHFTDIVAEANSLSGKIKPLEGHELYLTTLTSGPNRYKKNFKIDESEVLNEVHIYSNYFSAKNDSTVVIPIADVNRIEKYDRAAGSTVFSWVLGGVGLTAGGFVVAGIIAAIAKGASCPFIYTSDGTSDYFVGEIYSGSIYPSLERHDYLPLPKQKNSENEFSIRMTNEVKEIQNTNLIEMEVFDHPEGTTVLVDKYGNYQTFTEITPPLNAIDLDGNYVLDLIQKKDSLSFLGEKTDNLENTKDGIILTFNRPPHNNKAKLVINAKNTLWLDNVTSRFHKMFGEKYDCWMEKQNHVSAEKMKQWVLDQNIPLSVFIEKKGKWKFVDYFNIAGPMVNKEDVLALDLTGLKSDSIKVKLESGSIFWEIDYVGIDYSDNIPLKHQVVTIESAIDNYEKNVKDLLTFDDDQYYIQPEIGDEVLIQFTLPEKSDAEQTLILHSKGFYQIIMDNEGKYQRKNLLTFKRKGRMPEFSNQLLLHSLN